MGERREPFVAYMSEASVRDERGGVWDRGKLAGCGDPIAVVVTPLEPGDPRPGDRFMHGAREVEALSPATHGLLIVKHLAGGYNRYCVNIASLRPKPETKTYRLKIEGDTGMRAHTPMATSGYVTLEAESKDAALALIREQLEEVE